MREQEQVGVRAKQGVRPPHTLNMGWRAGAMAEFELGKLASVRDMVHAHTENEYITPPNTFVWHGGTPPTLNIFFNFNFNN